MSFRKSQNIVIEFGATTEGRRASRNIINTGNLRKIEEKRIYTLDWRNWAIWRRW